MIKLLQAEYYSGEDSPLICDKNGNYTKPSNFRKRFYRIIKKLDKLKLEEGLVVRFGFALRTNGSATVATQQYPPHRSSLKTVHRTVLLTLRPSQVQVLFYINNKKQIPKMVSAFYGRGDATPDLLNYHL